MNWKIKDRELDYNSKTLIMGIVNVTPDSFSDGGYYFVPVEAINQALKLEADGADIIDIGAQSTRPGAERISANEEWSRLEKVLDGLKGKLNIPISVDTFYPDVAEKAIKAGAQIINDVSGVVSDEIAQIVKEAQCGYVIMHNGHGTPEQVKKFFDDCIAKCVADYDIDIAQLCFDVGIGFGKDYDENINLLANIKECKCRNIPLLLGTSRKRVIGIGSEQGNPKERIYGNIAADAIAISGGVNIIRLHDVEHEKQGIKMADSILKGRSIKS